MSLVLRERDEWVNGDRLGSVRYARKWTSFHDDDDGEHRRERRSPFADVGFFCRRRRQCKEKLVFFSRARSSSRGPRGPHLPASERVTRPFESPGGVGEEGREALGASKKNKAKSVFFFFFFFPTIVAVGGRRRLLSSLLSCSPSFSPSLSSQPRTFPSRPRRQAQAHPDPPRCHRRGSSNSSSSSSGFFFLLCRFLCRSSHGSHGRGPLGSGLGRAASAALGALDRQALPLAQLARAPRQGSGRRRSGQVPRLRGPEAARGGCGGRVRLSGSGGRGGGRRRRRRRGSARAWALRALWRALRVLR